MDALDFKIFREIFYSSWPFQWTVRAPFTEVARKLQVTDDTVRSRIRRMQESGFLRGWETVVNPSVLGLQAVMIEVPPISPKKTDECIEIISLMEGSRWIFPFESGRMRLMFFLRDGPHLDRVVACIGKITGTRPERWHLNVERSRVRLTRSDWKLIAAIRRDSRRSVHEIEKATGLPRRTLQRRLTRLIESRAIFTSPVNDLSRMGSARIVSLRIPPDADVDPQEVIHKVIPDTNFVAKFQGPTTLGIAFLQGPEEIASLKARAKQELKGQRHYVDVFKHRITCHSWLDSVVHEQVQMGAPDEPVQLA